MIEMICKVKVRKKFDLSGDSFDEVTLSAPPGWYFSNGQYSPCLSKRTLELNPIRIPKKVRVKRCDKCGHKI